jgi:hypothetical protein
MSASFKCLPTEKSARIVQGGQRRNPTNSAAQSSTSGQGCKFTLTNLVRIAFVIGFFGLYTQNTVATVDHEALSQKVVLAASSYRIYIRNSESRPLPMLLWAQVFSQRLVSEVRRSRSSTSSAHHGHRTEDLKRRSTIALALKPSTISPAQ